MNWRIGGACSTIRPAGQTTIRRVFPWLLLFADDLGDARAEPAFQLALAEGSRLNVSILGLADSLASLPQRMGGVAAFKDPAEKLLSYTDVGAEFEPVECDADAASPAEAEELARALGAITPAPEHGSNRVSLPDRLSLFEALDIPTIEHLDVQAKWSVPDLKHLLRLPLGLTSGESLLELDLKEQALGGHGPHGLVAGTTGAGKSELLLTMIAGLAMTHPPDVLNFVLIDYKGGDAFSSVADLPHTLALITDLDEHLANRSLVFLTSELKQRERRLGELKLAEVTSAAEYQIARPPGQAPMPLLVIVVDEFARLKAELPDFVRGLVDVARVGRSLGVHLILATQTPGGSVDEEIKKNTNFGICLRVRDTTDSNDVIGEPDAFLLPGSLLARLLPRRGSSPCIFSRQLASARRIDHVRWTGQCRQKWRTGAKTGWRLDAATGGGWLEFDADGRLETQGDANGNTLRLQRDALGGRAA